MKTKRIKIAVLVGDNGEWWCAPMRRAPADEALLDVSAHDMVDAAQHSILIVEADIPLPEVGTIEGEVREG